MSNRKYAERKKKKRKKVSHLCRLVDFQFSVHAGDGNRVRVFTILGAAPSLQLEKLISISIFWSAISAAGDVCRGFPAPVLAIFSHHRRVVLIFCKFSNGVPESEILNSNTRVVFSLCEFVVHFFFKFCVRVCDRVLRVDLVLFSIRVHYH